MIARFKGQYANLIVTAFYCNARERISFWSVCNPAVDWIEDALVTMAGKNRASRLEIKELLAHRRLLNILEFAAKLPTVPTVCYKVAGWKFNDINAHVVSRNTFFIVTFDNERQACPLCLKVVFMKDCRGGLLSLLLTRPGIDFRDKTES